MSYGSGLLQNLAAPIGIVIAAGALVAAFKVGGAFDSPKTDEKPKCVEVRDPKSGLAMYNPDCSPERK